MQKQLNFEQAKAFIAQKWDDSIIPTLSDFISIPNQSPMFDPDWIKNGYTDQAVELMVDWVKKENVPGLELEVGNFTLVRLSLIYFHYY